MKTNKKTKPTPPPHNPGPIYRHPKYYLEHVPDELRVLVLDLCTRRLYHEAMRLLEGRGFRDYTQDDLINFYHWAPARLGQAPPEAQPAAPRDYPQPSAEQLADIRQRIPSDLVERINGLLMHESIDHVASLLWKAGAAFSSAELYEYRKTLFPPNALVDPYTSGPPAVRDAKAVSTQQERGQVVREPTPHTRTTCPRSDSTLLDDLRDVIKRYVVLPEFAAETLALWIVHTYAFTLRQVTTYIGIVSPEKRCGKTTLLELLGLLAHKAVAAANISPSALFRVIEEDQPTLIIDEADTFLQGRGEMAGILNAGYRKGNSYVIRAADKKPRQKPSSHPPVNASTHPSIHSSNNPFIQQSIHPVWQPRPLFLLVPQSDGRHRPPPRNPRRPLHPHHHATQTPRRKM